MSGSSVKLFLLPVVFLFLGTATAVFPVGEDSLTVVFWNLENFFDPRDDGGGAADTEFSSRGSRHWTWEKFFRKRDLVAKTLLWIGNRQGKLPEVVGIAEVENAQVLRSLCLSPPLKKAGYDYIHFDSPDHRGIDVGLLYLRSCIQILEVDQLPLVQGRDTLRTRSILRVRAEDRNGQRFVFLVNHHPSKFSGAEASRQARELAMRQLVTLCREAGDPVIAMGDFNDVPEASQFRLAEEVTVNLGARLCREEKESGSIRFEGKWQLIDFFLISPELDGRCRMSVCRPPFLQEWDGKHAGYKPFRTYSGPRYKGGVSDHFPVMLRIE